MMRLVDIMYALPFTIFVILLMVFFGRNIVLLFVAIGGGRVADHGAHRARPDHEPEENGIHRGGPARSGYSHARIIFRHLLPNALGPIIVYTTLTIPAVMLLEAFLSFLGLGVQPPMSSWGTLIKDGAEKMEEYWWLLAFPGRAVFADAVFPEFSRRRTAGRARRALGQGLTPAAQRPTLTSKFRSYGHGCSRLSAERLCGPSAFTLF